MRVYAFRNDTNGYTKIGISGDLEERRRTVASKSKVDVDCITIVCRSGEELSEDEARNRERQLHDHFEYRRVDELAEDWFDLRLSEITTMCYMMSDL